MPASAGGDRNARRSVRPRVDMVHDRVHAREPHDPENWRVGVIRAVTERDGHAVFVVAPEAGEEGSPDAERGHLLVVVGLALLADALALVVVAVERLDHLRAAEVVLQARVQPRHGLPDGLVAGFDPGEEPRARDADNRDRRERDGRQRRRREVEDDADAAHGGDDADDLPELRVEKGLQPVDIAVEDGEHPAGLVVDEEVHREVLEVVVGVVPEVALHLLGGRLQEIPRGESGDRPDGVREHGDDDELFQQREAGRLPGYLAGRQQADACQQPRLAGGADDAVDGRRDDDRRDESGEPRQERRDDADRQPKPVGARVRQQTHHRVAHDVVADILEPPVVLTHWPS